MDENLRRITGAGRVGTDRAAKLGDDQNNISDRDVFGDSMRVLPRQVSTGTQRGEQLISGSIAIVSANGQERIVLGNGPGGEFGIFGCTVNNNDPSDLSIKWKFVDQTLYGYDPNNDYKNNVQLIKLSNGEYGAAFSKNGEDLTEALVET